MVLEHAGVWYKESCHKINMVVWLFYLILLILITPNPYVSGMLMPTAEKVMYSSIFRQQKTGIGFWNQVRPIHLTIDWLCLMVNKMQHLLKTVGKIFRKKKNKKGTQFFAECRLYYWRVS